MQVQAHALISAVILGQAVIGLSLLAARAQKRPADAPLAAILAIAAWIAMAGTAPAFLPGGYLFVAALPA